MIRHLDGSTARKEKANAKTVRASNPAEAATKFAKSEYPNDSLLTVLVEDPNGRTLSFSINQ